MIARLGRIEGKADSIVASNADLIAALNEANEATNEIAGDIDELLARETLSDEGVAQAQALAAKLRGVAAVVPEPEAPAAEGAPA